MEKTDQRAPTPKVESQVATPVKTEIGGRQTIIRIREKEFHFRKPPLGKRRVVIGILNKIAGGPGAGDLRGVDAVVRKHGWTPEEAMKMDEEKLPPNEKLVMTNYDGLMKIAERRKLKDVWEVVEIPDSELDSEELNIKYRTTESFDMMDEILPDVLYCTIYKVNYATEEELKSRGKEFFDDLDFDDAVVLFRNGLEFIKEMANNVKLIKEHGGVYRKN